MACACIRGSFDFDLIQDVCSDIVYRDRSTWQQGEEFSETPSYTLTIEDPSGKKTDHTVTVGTPLHLNLGECVTPGIFSFEVVSCADKYTKKVAIVCSLWCGYLRSFAKIGKGVDVPFLRSIRERIEHIERIAGTDFVSAQQLTDDVARDIRKINCECAC